MRETRKTECLIFHLMHVNEEVALTYFIVED